MFRRGTLFVCLFFMLVLPAKSASNQITKENSTGLVQAASALGAMIYCGQILSTDPENEYLKVGQKAFDKMKTLVETHPSSQNMIPILDRTVMMSYQTGSYLKLTSDGNMLVAEPLINIVLCDVPLKMLQKSMKSGVLSLVKLVNYQSA